MCKHVKNNGPASICLKLLEVPQASASEYQTWLSFERETYDEQIQFF